MEGTEKSTAVLTGTAVAECGDQVALVGVPEGRDSGVDKSGLLVVPGGRTGVTETSSKLSTFDQGTALDHQVEEMDTFGFLPKIKAGSFGPVVRDVFEIGLDN